jgi:hypothetical protein
MPSCSLKFQAAPHNAAFFKKSLDLTPTLWSKLLLYHQYSEKKRIWQYGADFLAIFPVIFLVLSPAMWYTEKKRKEE